MDCTGCSLPEYAVEVPVDLHMVVEAGAAAPPLGILVGLGRQGQERGPLDLLEQVAPADAEMAHGGAPVQLGQERSDRAGQLDQGEEAAVAEPGQNPTLDHCTATSTLALSRGLRTRVGRMAVPKWRAISW